MSSRCEEARDGDGVLDDSILSLSCERDERERGGGREGGERDGGRERGRERGERDRGREIGREGGREEGREYMHCSEKQIKLSYS